MNILEYDSILNFPNIGKPNMLYVAKQEHKTYYYDVNKNIYIIVGSDYGDIKVINGNV